MWSLYEPGKGEFSVPDTQAEVDAVLAGVQSGQIPVFRREGGGGGGGAGAAAGGGDEAAKAAAALAKQFEDAKALGNKAFAKGCYAKAAKLYSKCLEVDPASANAHTVLGNRAAAHLKLHNPLNEEGFAERSLADADAAVAREAGWGKGHFRRAQALAVLGRRRDAHAALQEARRLLPRDAGVGTALRNSDALLTMVAPGSAKAEAVHALLAAAYGWSATKADGKGGSPGWMPTQLDTSDTSRAALMRLYALVRDEASTARDRAAGSEYATAIPGLKPEAKTRKAALSHMVRAAGERGLIVLRASMLGSGDAKLAGLLELGQATAAPLESRSVPQLLACLLEVPELKKASEIFEKILAADPDAKTLLSSSVTSDEAAVDAAADAAAAQKAAREAEAAQKAAAEEAAKARVEQERAAAERASQAKAAADEKAAREKAEKAKRVARAMTDGRRVEQENVEEEKKAALRAVEGNKIKISVDKDFVMPAAVPVTGGAGSLGGMGAALGLGGAGAAPAHWDPLAGASSVIGNGIGKRAGIDNVSVTHAAHKNPLLGSSRGASGGYNAGSSADFGAADGSDYSTFF
jgi:tetratricopeptide (TPR) repeat protein